ncbi:putative acyl-CoA dehydrogenase [Streptomyces himastatinicus ATCC 53653]|uniref:Putative acyl-CoA dehydrogenase n=1 Tax=Streptomyces himastatinicus ATCC 53653 TaxID=457427 RepID=D9WPW2_9ACTN|nr:acyl-CoA dehydrogenase family protein [Streptomyces himastatinicus]EFL23966.1 putative acyl-CoA dehydrogenase [Streptomyces himastatinicus ATCC 53653]
MDFQLDDDQRALRDGMRDLLERRFPRTRLRTVVDGHGDTAPLDRALWRELGTAGFFALRLPEAAGGVGLGLPEAVLAMEEAGRTLLPGPLVATQLAAGLGAGNTVEGSAEVAAANAVEGAAEGAAVVTALDLGPGADRLVEHLASADAVLVLSGEDAEVLPAAALADPARPIRSVDPATPLHRVHPAFEAVAGTGAVGAAARLRREAALLTAAQQLGSASRTVRMAVDHATARTQFGRPIGAFQAVQHLCARMLVRAESARSVVYAAAVTEEARDIAAAKLLADEAAVHNARDCLQVHGGMGFTWEADVHLHLKRAWVRAGQWQTAAAAEEELAAGLLLTGETGL